MNKKQVLGFIAFAAFVFICGIVANYYAGIYAIERASSPVSDLVLSNIPVFDVDGIFVFGPVVLWVFFWLILLKRRQKIAFSVEALGLLFLVRAVFVTLTHIGPFPTRAPINYNLLELFSTGGDLFFSGHTAIPFMMALIFWDDFKLRAIFIGASIFFGAVVLMGHLHYSIDVAAAFFITYTTYHIASVIFRKSRQVFREGWSAL